jgi:hypothetical protein
MKASKIKAKPEEASKEAFGGCIRILGKSVTDRRDPAKVQAWAEELGKKLTEL